MIIAETARRVSSAWSSFRAAVETICVWSIAIGLLALVIHSWILLSNGNDRGAVGAFVCVVIGALGAILLVEQWLEAGQAAVHVWGCFLGRVERAQSARTAVLHAALAGFWWALLRFGGPIVLGFGFPSPGLEETLMRSGFFVFLANHAVKAPGRLSISWQAATTARAAAPGDLPPIGGIKL